MDINKWIESGLMDGIRLNAVSQSPLAKDFKHTVVVRPGTGKYR